MDGVEQPPGTVPQLVTALLSDFSSPQPLSSGLIQLATSQEPTSVLLLSSAVHQLLAATFSPSASSSSQLPAQLAAFFHDSLFAALNAQNGPTADDKAEQKAALADTLIDVVWQLDQEVDVQVPLLLKKAKGVEIAPVPAAEGEAMEVDGGAAAAAAAQAADQKAVDAAIAGARERLGAVVKQLIIVGDIPRQAALERLEHTLIRYLGIVGDPITFSRLEVRARTALYYKQQKFNLLREESEGYSKLIVELLSNMGPAHSAQTGESTESEIERKRRAVSVNDKVKNLIGNFDLDPSRTLDVFLDTFSSQALDHWQFFLDFLAASPWAPKPSVKPAPNGVGSDAKGKGKAPAVDVGIDAEEGNATIAQILGFKFAFYQGQDAPEAPQNLYLTAALLIWHGFVKLTDLWVHLSPSDDDLLALKSKYEEQQAQLARSVGGANALALAGALVDDEAPSSSTSKPGASSSTGAASTSSAPPPPPRELPNQKLALLRALLTIGDVTHSLFLLAQFPFLVSAFPDLADLLNRLIAVSIQPAYEEIAVSGKNGAAEQWKEELRAVRPRVTVDTKGERKATVPSRRVEVTGEAFPDEKRGDWSFFFPRWSERVPRAGDWEEVLGLLEGVWMPLVKLFVVRDFGVFTKLCRIIVADLGSDAANHPRRSRWLDLFRVHLVPGISLLEHHTPAALELWRVLSLFPIETRFQIYGEWKNAHYRRIPALGVRKAEAEKDIKSLLRRLSTENVKKLGKTFARIAHTNPTVIFAVALNQVQSYDNLIIPVVEAARYLTDLGYDVLAYSILEALSSERPKTKEDGTSIAMWLQGLATFTGNVYRRWAAMAPSLWIILQYLVNQLVSGNSKDLVVLRELIIRMTAIEPFADLSDTQVLSLAGGKHLRSEVFQQTVLEHASKRAQLEAQAKARGRLAEALLGRTELAMPLLVNIALQRQACLKTDAHLKSLGALFDQNHAILFQFTELLYAITEPDQLAALVPPVEKLIAAYHLDPAVAFDISRPKLRAALKNYDAKEAEEAAAQSAEKKKSLLAKLAAAKADKSGSSTPAPPAEANGGSDAKMEDVKEENGSSAIEGEAAQDEKMVMPEEAPNGATPTPEEGEVAAAEAAAAAVMTEGATPTASGSPATVTNPWHPGLTDAISSLAEQLPEEARTRIGAPFFVTFWQLTLYDIVYPKERYDAEIARLKAMQREAATNNAIKPEERDRFIKSIIGLATTLMDEASKHMNARNTVSRRLNREKGQWFAGVKQRDDRVKLADEILQYCIQPRARLSLPDAVYSHQMIRRLHSLNTPGFHTIVVYNRLLTSQISPILYSCTENEARNYGRFLYDVLGDLSKWHKSKTAYDDEAIGTQLSGFMRSMDGRSPDKPDRQLYYSHDDFRQAVAKWHGAMVEGFAESFESGEYMHIKNSILVLTKIAPYFPLEYRAGEKLEQSVTKLLAAEKREDLTILAQGYKAVIAKRRKHWIEKPKEAPKPKEATELSPAPAASPSPAPPAKTAPTANSTSSTTSAKPADKSASTATSTSTRSSAAPPTGPAAASSAIPTGPRHTLPTRPGEKEANRPASANADPKASTSSSVPSRPAGDSGRRAEANGNLPARPDADKLRADALASKRATPTGPASSSKAMDPPPAPTGPSRSLPDRPSNSRPSSRAATPPRASDADRERRSRNDGREGDRERSSRPRSPTRERSVESSHSGRTSGRDRDSRDVKEKDGKDRRADERDRDRDRDRDRRDERSSRDSRSDRDSRSGRDDRSDRGSSRRDDRRDEPRSSRRDDDRYKTGSSSTRRPEDDRRDGRRTDESSSSRRTSDRTPKLSRAEEEREREKEKQRQRDAEREEEREKERKVADDRRREEARRADREREREREEAKKRDREKRFESSSRLGSSAPAASLPAKPGTSRDKISDILRPPAAERGPSEDGQKAAEAKNPDLFERARAGLPGNSLDELPARASPAGEGLSIKGRGRLFEGLTSGGGGKRDDDSSRKRGAGSLADRLGGAPEEKRPRTDDVGRDGGGRRDGGGGGGGRRSRR
ncbi:hypothetical protein JCM11251_005848 [Rhodosporidiobolus azoricus]